MTDYFLYVLYLSNGTFYVGQTSDPHRRIHDHSHGRGSFYTNRSQHHTLVALI
ncbi:MAG: GIY-YIG nuclease family protein [Xanthobacteraceae bacterium]